MPSSLHPSDQLIVALDGMTGQEASSFVAKLPELRWVKVGLELFLNGGLEVLLEMKKQGKKVFLDLKFHDIPITMAGACRQAAKTGAELITVHACAGRKALLEAKAAAIEGASEQGFLEPTLLGVTVLTSWDEKHLAQELLISQPLEERVCYLADLVEQAGLGGCVCSPWEVGALRKLYPDSFELVTPGIREKGSDVNDQSRVMTPSEAIQAGASRLVVGRSVTCAADPREAFLRFSDQLIIE